MLHQRLRELREHKGLTQAEIAQLLQITREAYTFYENNKRQMSYDSLCVIADFYGVTTDSLLGRAAQEPLLLSDEEKEMLARYRGLDARGKENVLCILDLEHARAKPAKEKKAT